MSQNHKIRILCRMFVQIPNIAAVLDGREFEVLIDVVSFLITAGPKVETCTAEERLLLESENELIEDARNSFNILCRQVEVIQNEMNELECCFSDLGSAGVWSEGEPLPVSGASVVRTIIPWMENSSWQYPSNSLRELIKHNFSSKDKTNAVDFNSKKASEILLYWTQEQHDAAIESYKESRTSLKDLKERIKVQLQSKNASRVLIQLNRVVWQLCDQERVPFVQASIKKVIFDRRQNRDHSGSARFIIHRLDILDATGVLPEGPATPAGVILSGWNPDESYKREPTLRIISTFGVPTSTHIIYEHLDATLHPLSLHLTEQIATMCWEYFFPKEDSKSRQEAFTHTVSARKPKKTSTENFDTSSPSRQSGTGGSQLRLQDEQRLVASSPSLSKQNSGISNSDIRPPSSPRKYKKKEMSVAERRGNPYKRKLTKFVYVKLNRAHTRITYQGYPMYATSMTRFKRYHSK